MSSRSGTIPARAGEPSASNAATSETKDYPRSRGGTRESGDREMINGGLSPLARGNRLAPAFDESNEGTIPARAGEPDVCTLK